MGNSRNHRPISLVHRALQKSLLALGCDSVESLSFVPRPSLEQSREEVDIRYKSTGGSSTPAAGKDRYLRTLAESPERLGVGVISDTPGQRVKGRQSVKGRQKPCAGEKGLCRRERC